MTGLKTGLLKIREEMISQECYQKYTECLNKIKADSELYQKLNEFRRRNVELHFQRGSLREEAYLETEYHSLLMNELVHEFLKWENQTLAMVRMIHEEIDGGLNLDFDFF